MVLAGTGSSSEATHGKTHRQPEATGALKLKMDGQCRPRLQTNWQARQTCGKSRRRGGFPKAASDVGKLLDRMEKLKFASDEWAGLCENSFNLAKAVQRRCRLDSTNDEMMLRYLAFVCAASVTNADPKRFAFSVRPAVASDFGYTVQDPELLAFMQQHDYTRGKSKPVYEFGRPINEFRATLQQLTGSTHGEDELVYVYLEGPPHQRLLQRSLFQSCAARWARWWQAHWKEYVSDGYYSRVNLGPLPAEETRTSYPRAVETSNVYGSRPDILLKPVGKAGALHVFFDLDLDFAVGETAHQVLGHADAELLAHGFSERAVGVAAEYQQVAVCLH